MQNALSGLNQYYYLEVFSFLTAEIVISGNWIGTLIFEGSIDDTTYVPLADNLNGGNATQTTANGTFRFDVTQYKKIRFGFKLYTTGTTIITPKVSQDSILSNVPVKTLNWGEIGGVLANQIDLQAAFDAQKALIDAQKALIVALATAL